MGELLEQKDNNWIADLAFETALGYYTPEELRLKYELSPQKHAVLETTDTFKRAVQAYRREIDEAGEHFKLKARKMASEILDVLFEIAGNPEATDKDRILAIDNMCKYAGFDKQREEQQSTGITIQIANFDNNSPAT